MNLLLDTHIVLWWLDDSPALPSRARQAVANPNNVCFVSAVTIWEIEIKSGLGKLRIPEQYADELKREGFRELAVGWTHTLALRTLPLLHRDPFDRLLIAQATCEDLTIVTADQRIGQYAVRVLA